MEVLKSIGYVERPGEPQISRATWGEIVDAFDLRLIDSCKVVNPFTKELVTFTKPQELGAAIVNGRQVGVVRWGPKFEGLDILGESEPMYRLAEAIAERIGARFIFEPC